MAGEDDKRVQISAKDFQQHLIVLNNIKEAGNIVRFKFTESETAALEFAIAVVQENLNELMGEN